MCIRKSAVVILVRPLTPFPLSVEARTLFDDVKLLLLEGSPQHNATLAKVVTTLGKDADYRIGVLSETAGETVEYFQGKNTGNSMFRENSKHYVNDIPVKRITSTLDTMVENSHLKNERIDVIKVDAQGAELVVFKGAIRTLSQATFVYFEGSVVEYNEGGACLYEIDAFLRSQGFFLYDYDAMDRNDAFFTRGLGQLDGRSEYCFRALVGRPTCSYLRRTHPSFPQSCTCDPTPIGFPVISPPRVLNFVATAGMGPSQPTR
jgi:FkbM family methyltransferase